MKIKHLKKILFTSCLLAIGMVSNAQTSVALWSLDCPVGSSCGVPQIESSSYPRPYGQGPQEPSLYNGYISSATNIVAGPGVEIFAEVSGGTWCTYWEIQGVNSCNLTEARQNNDYVTANITIAGSAPLSRMSQLSALAVSGAGISTGTYQFAVTITDITAGTAEKIVTSEVQVTEPNASPGNQEATANSVSKMATATDAYLLPGHQYRVRWYFYNVTTRACINYLTSDADVPQNFCSTPQSSRSATCSNSNIIALDNPGIFVSDVTYTISGSVLNDNNGQTGGVNGSAVAGVGVTLYAANGTTVLASTTTDTNGSYSFPNLNPVNYVVGLTPPAGFSNVSSTDSSPTDGRTSVTVGTSTPNIDFGINQPPTATPEAITCQKPGAAATINNLLMGDTDPNNGTLSSANAALVVPAGATGNTTGFTVPNQGTWVLNTPNSTTASLTFTPQSGYTGNPTPVQYTVTDAAGLVSNAASATIGFAPVAPTVTVTQPTCAVPTGTISVTQPTMAANIAYSVNGVNYQASNTFTGLAPGATYPVTVRNTSTGCTSDATSAVVNPAPAASTVSSQPADQRVRDLDPASFTVTVSGGSGMTKHQWQVSTNNGTSWTNLMSSDANYSGISTDPTVNTLSSTLQIKKAAISMNGYLYRDVVTQDDATCMVQSTSAKLTINQLPTANNDTATTPEDTPVSGNAATNDSCPDGGCTYSLPATGKPQNGTVTLNPDGTYTYTPNANFNGTDTFTYQVCDKDGDCATATVTITVTPVNDVPVANNDSNTTTEDTPVNGNVATNDSCPDGGCTYSLPATGGPQNGPQNGTVTMNPDGTYTYTPNANFNGTDTFTYQLCDKDGDCATATVTITVTPVNDVPVANNDSNTTAEDTPVSGNVSGNDSCPDGGCTYSLPATGKPQNGTVTLNPDGSYTYTPNANFNGTDTFTYQVCDKDGDCATATVTITVTPVNDVPVANNDSNTTPEDTPVSGNVSTNDSCPDGGCSFAITQAGAPKNGTVTLNPDGTYTYTPNANFNGTDTFTYQVCDKDGDCTTATVTITVTPVNDVPIANNDTATTAEDTPVSGNVATNDSCPDGGCTYSLPATGKPQNGTVTLNPDGTYTYTPNANFNGTDTFTYQVCDKDGDCATATVTITVTPVNDVPTATDDSNTTAEDSPVNGNAATNDSCPDGGCTYSLPATGGPQKGTVTLNPDGTYTYTPNANFNGTDTFTYQVCDKDGDCTTAIVTITVTPVNDVPIANNDTATTAEDTPVSGNVTTNDSCPDGGCTYSLPATGKPQNGTVTLNPDGSYTYTPNANFNGTDSFTYQVCDKDGDCATATVTITVTPVNDVPVANNDSNTTPEDSPVNGNVSTNDSCPDGGCTYSLPATGKPQNGTVTMNPDGTYTYTPNANFNGTDTFTYQVCDKDGDCTTATVTITVTPVNDVPVANNDTATTQEDTPVSGNVATNDSCPDGGCTYSLPATGKPQNGTVTLNPDGTYTYTPNANFNGTDSFTYQVCDKDGDCATATVTITVTPVNDVPVANNDTATTPEDTPVSGNVSTNDSCPDGGCTYSLPVTGGPQNGTVTLNPDGTYTYTPNANFNGTDTFTYQVCDKDGDCTTATVTITVTPVNDVPVANNDTATTPEDTPVSGNVSTNDSCPDGGCTYSLPATGGPQNGTVTLNPDGTYTYTPNANFNGTDTFTYQVCDKDGDCATATVTITVTPVNDVPVANNDSNTTPEDTPVSGNVATNDSCPDGGCSFAVTSTGAPQNGTVTLNPDGTYTYTPNANFNGTDTFTYQVCDKDGDCATATVTITVTPVNDVPVANNDSNTTPEDSPVNGNVATNDSCPDGGCTYSLPATGGTQNGTVTLNPDGTYTYTPNANFNGTDTFTYQVCDKDGDCATATVTITVTPVNDVPVANNDSNTTAEDTPVSGNVTTNDSCPDGGCTYSLPATGGPQNGTVTLNPDGTYTYTPNANFNGTDTFTYQVCDKDGDCATATVTITVTPVNDVPVANNDTATTPEDTPVSGNVSTNDSCPDGGCTYSLPATGGPQNGTVTLNPDGTYTYTPNANFNGTDTFTYQVCDKDGDCATATVTITVTPVNDVPVANNDSNTTAEDTPVSGNVATNDSCPDGGCTYSLPATGSPQNGTVTLNPDGTYTYTPNANFNGTDTFTYQVCDKDGDCATATVTITVTPVNDPPVASSVPVTTPQDTPVSGKITASDPDGDPLTFTVSTPPAHGTVTVNPDGTYTYTPAPGYNGPDSFVTTVCDDKGACITVNTPITVTAKTNNPPVASSVPVTTPQDTPVNGKITASDPDGDPLTFTVSTPPAHGTVTVNPDGTYTYTPAPGYNGPDSFVTTVCDDKGACTTVTTPITVTAKTNNPPVGSSVPVTTPQDTPVSGKITASDPDGDPLTFTVSTPPAHGTVTVNPDGTYTYTPAPGYNGPDSFVTTVCDDKGACTTVTTPITVTAKTNNPPVASSVPVTTPQDTPVSGKITASDPDGDPLTFTVSTPPAHGTVTVNPDGTYTYTPAPGYNGPDSFVTTVCDDKGACTTVTTPITVTAKINNPPVASSVPVTTPTDTPVNGKITASDPDGDPLTFTVSTPPAHGTVTVNPDGTYTYTPAPGYNGPDSFVTTVCDDKGACTTVTTPITVTAKTNNPPVASSVPVTTPQDTPVNGKITASDPDGDPLTFTVSTPPAHGTVTVNPDGTYTYTPAPGYNGPDSFVTTVCDDKGACTTVTTPITVTAKTNNPPVASSVPVTTPKDTPVSGKITASDPDGDPLTFTVSTPPAHGTVTVNPDGTYIYTPAPGYNGPDSFVTTVCDDKGACTTVTTPITVTVNPNNPPVASSVPVTTPKDTPVSGKITASDPDGDPLTFTVSTPPAHGTVTVNPDGTYTYTPAPGYNGPDNFVTTVCDDKGACTTVNTPITVTAKPNNPPVASSVPVTTPQDTPVSGKITASDPDGDPLTFTVSTPPAHGTVTVNPDGTFTYTPAPGYNGPDSFVTTVCDDKGACTTVNTPVVVTPATMPVANVSVVKTVDIINPAIGTQVVFSIRVANAGPGDAANVVASDLLPSGYTFLSANAPNGTAYSNTSGVWTIGTLTNGTSMTLTITARVNAAGNYANTATVTSSTPDGNPNDNTSTVTPAPRALANVSVIKTVDNAKPVIGRNVVFTIQVTNDGPGDATGVQVSDLLLSGYTFVSANAPNGTNYNNSTGAWTIGTLVNQAKMNLTITARVNAAGNYTNTATISSSTLDDKPGDNISSVTPVPVAAKPVAVDDAAKTAYNTPVQINILGNDKPDGSPLVKGSVEIVTQPANGSVSVNADGTVTYTPKPGYTGTDPFTYRVKDENGNWTNVATVTIEIEGFFIPNVFTPNGDGKNDTFFIVGLESFDSVDIEIYNRWGNQVYRTKGYRNDWTGADLNEGTYYYKITFKKGATVQRVAGPVLLKRY